ncbi:energy transducer TonB [Mucilaginibacter rigui]|uniref:Energy transducer TonB n=1 Tax=Mucilaginibacter rigui TaxID=534635 RepID=A0ABR7XCV7_9SPHI|nr:energy transducer TonB [Mucilaginibacter rigui]MBD1387450.1 energy transducer TonB [Mucilaginibacter rigui]
MKKRTLLISLIALGVSQAFAQTKNVTTVYMANSGDIVESKEKADFVRQILSPDPEVDKKTSTVLDFYMNGNKKLIAHTRDAGTSESLYGSYIEYFKDGNRKSIRNYKNGTLVGDAVFYYPNGQTYYTTNNNRIVQSFDANGNAIAENGNGKWIIYNDNFKVIAEGAIVNGKQNGEWTGFDEYGVKTTGVYKSGVFVSGNLFANDNKVYENCKDFDTQAAFRGGDEKLGDFLSRNTRHSKSIQSKNIDGSVLMNFIIEKDGSLSNIKVVKGISADVDAEAVRVLENSPKWQPGVLYGVARRVSYTLPISFSPESKLNPSETSPFYSQPFYSIPHTAPTYSSILK